MAALGLTFDPAQAERALRRKEFDAKRLKVVLDDKRRTIGVDKDTLDKQVAELNDRRRKEAEQAVKDGWHARYLDSLAAALEHESTIGKRTTEARLRQESLTELRKERRREWHLSDPEGWKRDKPARGVAASTVAYMLEEKTRSGIAIPRDEAIAAVAAAEEAEAAHLGPASMQVFDGEDRRRGDRSQEQKSVQAAWLLDQMREHEAQRAAEADEAAREAAKIMGQTALRGCVESEVEREKQEARAVLALENTRLAREAAQRKLEMKLQDEARNQAELAKHASDPMLNELPPPPFNATQSAPSLDAPRVRRDGFKGMTVAQRQAVYDERVYQQLDARARIADERAAEAHWADVARQQAAVLEAVAAEKHREVTTQVRDVADDNRGLAKSQRMSATLLKQTYANKVTEDFFKQFQTSHR